MALVLVVEIAQHQGHATVGIIIDTVMGARRHCLIHDRLRLENEFVVLHFDEQVLGLKLSVGATHDYTDLVYRCITGSEPFPDGWPDRKFPEILLLARLPLAFVSVLVPIGLDTHPFCFDNTYVGVHVLLVIIERGLLVCPVIKHARRIRFRQFRDRKKSCSRRIYKFIYRILSHIYDSGLVPGRGKRNGRCPQFLVVFRNCDNDIARTGSRCLVYFKPVILGDCSRPLRRICLEFQCLRCCRSGKEQCIRRDLQFLPLLDLFFLAAGNECRQTQNEQDKKSCNVFHDKLEFHKYWLENFSKRAGLFLAQGLPGL